MDVGDWLRSLGLPQYEAAFRENAIDSDVLPELSEGDLEKLGLPLGHRKRLLKAISALGSTAAGDAPISPGTPPRDAAERRQLTVMFCDLVGSTALSARLDPEDMREIIGAYHRCCADQINKAGGFVAKYMGDGVLAYFGYPEAREDDAERSLRAALALTRAVAKLRTSQNVALQIRVGISTGLVVVGDLIGEGAAQEQGVVGDTPNLAARLQDLAEPGQVVISHGTRRLTAGLFEYRHLGRVPLKGLSDPVEAWQVLGPSAVESRFEAQRGAALTPLVGREEELELLTRLWRQAKAAEGSVVLISGEPGIGKSRIVQALLGRLGAEPYTRLRWFCSPHYQDTALYPTITQLERAAGFRREDTDLQRLEKLEAVLGQATSDLGEIAPPLAALLSIPAGDRYALLDLSPQKQKEKTLKALVAQIEEHAARQPVLLAVEDAHWIDPTSLELLNLIVDRVPTLPVMLSITFRPEFAPPWIGRSHVTSVILNRLPRQLGAEMIASVAEGKVLPKAVIEQIVERTDGIPLFIEELTKAVGESGVLADAADRYRVAGASTPLFIPETLHASLLSRLDRLAPVREVAQIGAALGRQFSHELICAVASMPQHQLDDALIKLERAELIFCRGTPPEAEYIFKHALVQDAAYSTLLRARRRDLHRRIAEAVETRFPEKIGTQPELLAHHFTEAGLGDRAVDYWRKAGEQAMARSAMAEAVSQLRKGLDLVSNLPDNKAHQQQELNLQIALGHALIATRGYTDEIVGKTYARARHLSEKLVQNQQLLLVMFGEWLYHVLRGELESSLGMAEGLLRAAQNQDDSGVEYLAHSIYLRSLFVLGAFTEARSHGQRARDLYSPIYRERLASLTAEDPQCATLIFSSLVLACLGHLDQARANQDEAIAMARTSGHADTISYTAGLACFCSLVRRDLRALSEHVEEVLAWSGKHGFPFWEAWGNFCKGYSLAQAGRPEDGILVIGKGSDALDMMGMLCYRPFRLMMLAEAHGRAGRPAEGLKHLDAAVSIIERTREREFEAELHRIRGELLEGDDREAAEESYGAAIAVARKQQTKLWELRASTSLARLWRNQGKRTEARNLLAPIYGWFTEGFDTLDLKEAKALLVELAA